MILNSCRWNFVNGTSYGFNIRDSVKMWIRGLGRLDVAYVNCYGLGIWNSACMHLLVSVNQILHDKLDIEAHDVIVGKETQSKWWTSSRSIWRHWWRAGQYLTCLHLVICLSSLVSPVSEHILAMVTHNAFLEYSASSSEMPSGRVIEHTASEVIRHDVKPLQGSMPLWMPREALLTVPTNELRNRVILSGAPLS